MKDRHKIFSLLVEGKKIDKTTKKTFSSVMNRYTDILLCKAMGWSQREIEETDVDFYHDTLLVLELQKIKEHKKPKRNKR